MSFMMRRGINSSAVLGGATQTFSTTALTLNGTSQYVRAPSATEFQLPTDMVFSFEFSFKADLMNSQETIYGKYNDTGGSIHEYYTRLTAAGQIVTGALKPTSVSIYAITFSKTFVINTLYNAVIASSGSTLKLYVDGVLEQTVAYTYSAPRQSTSAFSIGARSRPTGDLLFDGSIGTLRKYNQELSLADVQSNYNSGDIKCSDLAVSGAVFDVDLAKWAGRDQPLIDNSGNGNDLTATGSPTYTDVGLTVECT